ncbi:MAG: ribonuclease P protein component 4 [Candidatus Njordarchaeota archaeon]
MKNRRKKEILKIRKKIAREHIEALMQRAIRIAVDGNIKLAEQIAGQARRIARLVGVRMPKRWKYFFCRHCKSFIFPGITARVRIRQNRFSHIVIFCYKCKNFKRIPIKTKK